MSSKMNRYRRRYWRTSSRPSWKNRYNDKGISDDRSSGGQEGRNGERGRGGDRGKDDVRGRGGERGKDDDIGRDDGIGRDDDIVRDGNRGSNHERYRDNNNDSNRNRDKNNKDRNHDRDRDNYKGRDNDRDRVIDRDSIADRNSHKGKERSKGSGNNGGSDSDSDKKRNRERSAKKKRLSHIEHGEDDAQRNKETEDSYIPKTVALSKLNEEFYSQRRWPEGIVRYIIQSDHPAHNEYGSVDIPDVRKRLDEVNRILKNKTCTKIEEITEEEARNYEDYLVLDCSPDYVTGRVGGRQQFGVVDLLHGGQHTQHAAMMVMAMLGFYFEISRHDRDNYIVVHNRHIRPDKLHHFERIREDATLDVSYDYKSATHPSWPFWRKLNHTGIATVATYKEHDPNGSIMKALGQHSELLSEIDIVKINSVYGIDCFEHTAAYVHGRPVNVPDQNHRQRSIEDDDNYQSE